MVTKTKDKLYKVWDEDGKFLFEVDRTVVDFVKSNIKGAVGKHPFGYTVFRIEFSSAIKIHGQKSVVRLYLYDQYMVQLDKDEG